MPVTRLTLAAQEAEWDACVTEAALFRFIDATPASDRLLEELERLEAEELA